MVTIRMAENADRPNSIAICAAVVGADILGGGGATVALDKLAAEIGTSRPRYRTNLYPR